MTLRTLTALVFALVFVGAVQAAARPNIVLIMADDMGYECVGVNGGQSYQTPNLDKLAATGLRFTHAYSQPICTPSRVQIMTGFYNSRNYIRFGLLDPSAQTFGHIFKAAGYNTCIVGKWQLKGGFDGPRKFGFDEYCLWQLTRRPNRYPNPGLEVNGREINYTDGQYGPDIVSDYACDFIERHAGGKKPFFLYYPMILPHWPFEPTPDSPEWNPKARLGDKAEQSGKGVDNKFFKDMVAYTDKMVGKVVVKLDELGIRDNTLLIFTGDNGTAKGITSMMNGKPVAGGKGMMTDAGTHVPLIASWPGTIDEPAVCNDLVDFSDFLPTLAEVAGAAVPPDLKIDGRSIAPQLRGQEGEPRRWVYCWYYRNGRVGEKSGGESARTHRYKLYNDGRFYDVAKDVLEKRPLAAGQLDDPAREIRAQLQAVLDQYTRKTPPPKSRKKKKTAKAAAG